MEGKLNIQLRSDFDIFIDPIKFNLFIITYNSIKILYESMIYFILFLFEMWKIFYWLSSNQRKVFFLPTLCY